MNIVLFTHPQFLNSRSMKKYAGFLSDGMRSRNHKVEICAPEAFFYRIPLNRVIKKWLGYIDSYVIFPIRMRFKLNNYPANSLFVFSDQALGMWVSLIANKPHVIHCHDFLALKSALDKNPEYKVSWTGKIYQRMIRNGFSKAKNFISISHNTRRDLHNYLLNAPASSNVVYNQLSTGFTPENKSMARQKLEVYLGNTATTNLNEGYILHVGANVWYKNKRGVLEIYNAWRQKYDTCTPLVMVGELDADLTQWINDKFWKDDLYFLEDIAESLLVSIYSGASVFLFPSLAEGFGWPIAEAMACKCPVITTGEAPMTEVGGQAAFYIPKRPVNIFEAASWAQYCAGMLQDVLQKDNEKLEKVLNAGLAQVEKFHSSIFLDQTEEIYRRILEKRESYQLIY